MSQGTRQRKWTRNVKPRAEHASILLTCDHFWPYVGGAEISSFMICRELSKLNWDIYVLTNRLPRTQCRQSYNRININRENLFIGNTLNIVQRLLFYIRSAFLIVKYISEIRPAVILTQQLIAIPTVLISRLFGIPVIVMVRDYWPVCYYRSLLKPNLETCVTYDNCMLDSIICVRSRMKQHLGMMKSLEPFLTLPYSLLISIHSLLAKSVVKRSDAIIAVSNFVKRVLAVNGFDPRKIHVIYNPIDTVGRTCSSKRRLPPFILFVGSLSLEKGIQNVIKIMPQVRAKAKETCLTIVGDGPEREYLRSLISELNVENCVQLLGRITDDHLAGLYQSSSLVVVPSIWPEPFGRVVAEALSYNKPVVASSVGGISELVDRDDGILVPPNDENALMNALVLILTGGSSKSGPHRDSKFSPQAIAMQYNSVIASTIRSIRAEIHN